MTDNYDFSWGEDTSKEITSRVSFHINDYENNSDHNATHNLTEEDETWTVLLSKFINFVEGVYGYPIRHKIAVYDAPALKAWNGWDGPTFNKYTVNIPPYYQRQYFEWEKEQKESVFKEEF